jgi:phage terminase large subunit GpA-like protein
MTQVALEEPAAWTPNMRQAFRPPETMLPSEWAERYRTLTRGQSARAGPWRNDQAPYLRAFMDLPVKRGVVQVNIQKCAQAGGSETLWNLIGYMAHLDPDPIGLALPDRDKGRRIVRSRILPLFRYTPVLRALATERIYDVQTEQIMLSKSN